MIREEEVFYIGHISKFRGIAGEVELSFTDDAFDRGTSEYLVLEADGILVPFFWEEYKFKNDKTAIFKFEDIDDEVAAKRLVGKRVFYPFRFMPEEDDNEIRSWQALTGFTVKDADGTLLGTIDTVDDSSSNILFFLKRDNGKDLIIPFHDDFLIGYSVKDRQICLELPDGLTDLNE